MRREDEEKLNKYLDNELSNEEVSLFNNQLAGDEELRINFLAAKKVEETLPGLEIKKAPSNFVSKLMRKITKEVKIKASDNTVFIRLLAIYSFVIVLLSALVMWIRVNYSEVINFDVDNLFNKVVNFGNNDALQMLIPLSIVVIMLAANYFFYQNHKRLKEQIKSL